MKSAFSPQIAVQLRNDALLEQLYTVALRFAPALGSVEANLLIRSFQRVDHAVNKLDVLGLHSAMCTSKAAAFGYGARETSAPGSLASGKSAAHMRKSVSCCGPVNSNHQTSMSSQ